MARGARLVSRFQLSLLLSSQAVLAWLALTAAAATAAAAAAAAVSRR